MRAWKISGALLLGCTVAACGGAEGEMKPPAPPAPPAPPVAVNPTPAPAATTEAPAAPKPTMAEMQVTAMKGVSEGWNTADGKKVAGFYAENATFIVAGQPEMKGREAIAAHVKMTADAFKTKLGMTRSFQKGDMMATEWVATGVHTGEYMGIKGTEKPVGIHGVSILWFNADGLIKEQHDYMDGATLMAQMGVSKEKARPVAALPTGAPEMVVAKGTPDEDKNVESVKSMYAAMEKKTEADFLAPQGDAMEYEDYCQPATIKGKAESKKFFAMITKAFPDMKLSPTASMGVGDFAIVEAEFKGTQKGPMGPIPATKKPVDYKSVDIFMFKDGKAQKGWTYANSMEIAMQLGLVKDPSVAGAKAAPKAADPKAAAPKAAAPKAADPKAAAPKK